MNLLILTKRKRYYANILAEIFKANHTVTVSDSIKPSDVLITFDALTKDEYKSTVRTIRVFVEDPEAELMSQFVSSNTEYAYNANQIWLLDLFESKKEMIQTLYPTAKVFTVPILIQPTNIAPKIKAPTAKINVIIRVENGTFNEASWRQLLICELVHKQNPNLISTVWVINNTNNFCAEKMRQELKLHKDGKIRVFTDFSFPDLLGFFAGQGERAVYLQNNIMDAYDPLAVLCAEQGILPIHTSKFLQKESVGIFYNHNDLTQGANLVSLAVTADISKVPDAAKTCVAKYAVQPVHKALFQALML
jgi:hypothetical protein